MIFQPSKDRLIKALSEGGMDRKIIKICKLTESQHNSLNEIRVGKGWGLRESRIITFNHNDVSHMMKRINDDGLTPEEVGQIAELSLSNESSVIVGQYERAILQYPKEIDFGEGSFIPQAMLMDGANWSTYRLYGLIPSGWWGRKK